MARLFFFSLCLELGCLAIRPTAPCVTGRLRAAQNGNSRPGHASLSSTSRIHVWRGACAAWTLRSFSKTVRGMGEKNRHTNLQVQARAALGAARGVGELLVVDLRAVDEHGRRHQRRRREGLPLVGRSPRDNMHHARRRRVGRAPPCVLAPPCVRTVARDVHGRRARRRLARSAPVDDRRHRWRSLCLLAIQNAPIDDRRHRWRSLCLLATQDGVQSRQLLQRGGNDSCRARRGWRIHLLRLGSTAARKHAHQRRPRLGTMASCTGPRRSHAYASSGVPRPLVGARDGLSCQPGRLGAWGCSTFRSKNSCDPSPPALDLLPNAK